MLQFLMNSRFIRINSESYAGSSSNKDMIRLNDKLINWEDALAEEVLLSQKDEDDDEIVKMVVGSDIVAG
ncbi:unnamed protein product [Brassica napus]|uniref:(rape) hypothetical protein n=1 Tax=Brassica napus TaxID=3708 RepID=A0A816ZMV8_BRANA|nr:unnamed protein product [Brassica napus]